MVGPNAKGAKLAAPERLGAYGRGQGKRLALVGANGRD